MSECVVRMEMPENCWVCPFGLDGYIWNENDARTHYVRFCSRHSGEEFHVLETDTIDRPWFCDSFVCALPEGHGRLVDGDKLKHASTDGRKWCDPCPVWGEIYRAETLVPAERREE